MIRERLTAQLLAGPPAADAVEVAGRLLAVQAQDLRAARLAVRARTVGLSIADVDDALSRERSLVITWLNRGTLHLVRRDDYPWLWNLTTPPLLTGNARRLAQEGVSPDQADRGADVIERSLRADGPLTRHDLRERLVRAAIPTAGQALVHLLALATFRGIAVRGPMAGREQAYVHAREWLGPPPRFDRERALAELARRYLAGHGPAGERDLARWVGLPLRDARAGLGAIAGELVERGHGLVDLAARIGPEPSPPPRLLGAFDPLLLGWTNREAILGEHERRVVSGGIFRPVALSSGRAVATWKIAGGRVALAPFNRLGAREAEALETDAADVIRFLGGPASDGEAASIAPPGRDSSAGRAHD